MHADLEKKWSPLKCCAFVGMIGMVFGGVEAGIIFGLKVCRPDDSSEPHF